MEYFLIVQLYNFAESKARQQSNRTHESCAHLYINLQPSPSLFGPQVLLQNFIILTACIAAAGMHFRDRYVSHPSYNLYNTCCSSPLHVLFISEQAPCPRPAETAKCMQSSVFFKTPCPEAATPSSPNTSSNLRQLQASTSAALATVACCQSYTEHCTWTPALRN
jgi:hypothetical protein